MLLNKFGTKSLIILFVGTMSAYGCRTSPSGNGEAQLKADAVGAMSEAEFDALLERRGPDEELQGLRESVQEGRAVSRERKDRGPKWEYDSGPAKDSKWAQLFAETPNYRAIGIGVLGGRPLRSEKFRWKYGPMYYRGRLEKNAVKVFVIGQEGAQDENLSNRSFTGSTGTKMQNFLRALGINKSYLFMNTYVYTINGQYDKTNAELWPKINWMTHDENSPIVKHRHKLFDYMYETNKESLNLIIGIGSAGKDTTVTYVRHMWKKLRNIDGKTKCPSIRKCDASVLGPVKVLGLPHPGGASPRNGGEEALLRLVKTFANGVRTVGKWIQEERNSGNKWLRPDRGLNLSIGGYKYGNASVPHRDFPFGTTWRLGEWGTTSNRKDRGRAIQLFSATGKYGAEGDSVRYDPRIPEDIGYLSAGTDDFHKRIPEMELGDLPWEPQRINPNEFDPGPGKFAKILAGYGQNRWPRFDKLGVKAHWSLGKGAVYRGRLGQAKILVLADQFSHDDLFSGRALSGAAGQKLQNFLNAIGIEKSYGIIRTIPVDTLGMEEAAVKAILINDETKKIRQEIISAILAEGNTELVLTVGKFAAMSLIDLHLQGIPVVSLPSPLDSDHKEKWQKTIASIKNIDYGRDNSNPSYSYDGNLTFIPRADMPFHMRWWMGTGGDRSLRANVTTTRQMRENEYPNYYKVVLPSWITKIPPRELTSSETQDLTRAP